MSIINKNPILKQSVINERQSSDVASASTIDLDPVEGNLIDVTGTTTITAITLSAGRERTVRFTGALTLTHGASLVLPGETNITTAAGDFAIFRGYPSGVARCVNYSKIDGVSVVTPGLELLSTTSASASSEVDVETGFSGTYENYLLIAENVLLSDVTSLRCRFKIGTYLTTSTYSYHLNRSDSGAAAYDGSSANASNYIQLATSSANVSDAGINLKMTVYNQSASSTHKAVSWEGVYWQDTSLDVQFSSGVGGNTGTGALTGIRFYPLTGTITSGNFKLYGYKK